MVYARNLVKYAPYAYPAAQLFNARSAAQVPQLRANGRTRTMVTTRSRTRVNRTSFKKAVENIKPAKHYSAETNATMTAGTIYTCSPTVVVTQGDLNSNRDGDAIILCSLKIKMNFFSDAVAGAYTYRILVGYSGEEYNASTFTSAALTSTELFLPNTAAFATHGIINPKAFTVLHDETVDINSQIAATVDLATLAFTVNLANFHFLYQSSQSIYGKTKNLYIVILGNVAGGTPGTTATGSAILSYDLVFK